MKELEKICFYCANGFVDDEDKIHCMLKDGIIVQEEDVCEDYN